MIVRAIIEYDVDVDELDEEFVDIEGFAKSEAERMATQDYIDGEILGLLEYEIIY